MIYSRSLLERSAWHHSETSCIDLVADMLAAPWQLWWSKAQLYASHIPVQLRHNTARPDVICSYPHANYWILKWYL